MPRRVPPGPYIDVCRRGLHVRIWESMYVLMPRQKFIPVFNEAWDAVRMRILKGKVKGLFYFHMFDKKKGVFKLVKFEWELWDQEYVRFNTLSTCRCTSASSMWVECRYAH